MPSTGQNEIHGINDDNGRTRDTTELNGSAFLKNRPVRKEGSQ
jgi:hypothetical protein